MKKIFNSEEYNVLNESHVENKSIVEAFLKVGPIRMRDGSIHNPSEFVNIVNSALMKFKNKHPWEYKYIQYARIVYLLDGKVTSTMCVDDRGDLYINVEFLYSFLKMNTNYIMFILYHEAMHNILDHVQRGIKYGKKTNNKLTWTEMNICADFEVNGQMVADHVCKPEEWVELKGCYDPQFKGLTFEMIANKKSQIKNVDTDLEWNPAQGGGEPGQGTGGNGKDNSQKSPDYQRGYDEMTKAISDLLAKNSGDRGRTEKELTSIFARTQKPDVMLSEIEKLISSPKTHFIMNSQMFESAETDAEWIRGLKDGFSNGLNKLYNQQEQSTSGMSAEEAAEAAERAAEEAEAAAEEAKSNAENQGNKSGNKQSGSEGEGDKNNEGEPGEGEGGEGESGDGDEQDGQSGSSSGKGNSKGNGTGSDSDLEDAANTAADEAQKAREAAERAKEAAERGDAETARKEAENARKHAENAKNAAQKGNNPGGEQGQSGESGQGGEPGQNGEPGQESKNQDMGGSGNNKSKAGPKSKEAGSDAPHSPITGDMPLTDISGANSMVGRIVKQSELEANLADSLKDSGYDTDDINSIRDELLSRSYSSSQEMSTLREQIVANKKNSVLADLCNQLNVEENVITELWEELVKKFLERTTTRKGTDETVEDEDDIRWGNKRYLSMDDIIMPYNGETDASPQYINIFIDCSGSIDSKICLYFLGIIENMCKKCEFGGIRLIPFSDAVEESKIVGCTQEELKDEKTLDMLRTFIYECEKNYYGGGGNSTSFLCMAKHIIKCDLAEPDGVYLVMTDGGLFDTQNIIKFKHFSERVLFCITDNDIKNTLKNKGSYLSWCVNPKYSFLDKVYIDLDEVDDI